MPPNADAPGPRTARQPGGKKRPAPFPLGEAGCCCFSPVEATNTGAKLLSVPGAAGAERGSRPPFPATESSRPPYGKEVKSYSQCTR